ncbi:MAG: hypothetical protein IPI56_11075 [Elusimicrobia bacterium]|nr:hypothetical protein [Elusimicrobiota bacterium]
MESKEIQTVQAIEPVKVEKPVSTVDRVAGTVYPPEIEKSREVLKAPDCARPGVF